MTVFQLLTMDGASGVSFVGINVCEVPYLFRRVEIDVTKL